MLPYSMGELLERCGKAYGPDVAVISGARRISYAEQLARIRQHGRALLGLGLRKGDRVALLMADRPELLDVYFGAAWAGLAIVPLIPRSSAADHAFLIADSGARAVVHDVAHAAQVDGARVHADIEFPLSVDADAVLDGGHHLPRLAGRQPDGPGRPEVSPSDRFGIFYTGGTDGRPKGAEHTHRTFLAAVTGVAAELGLAERGRFGHVAPLTHAGGMFALPTWLAGGTNVLLGGFDPDRFARTVAAERITATMMVPTMLYLLLDHLKHGREGLASLRNVVYGVSPLRQDRLMQALDALGPVFTQLYGQAEAPNQLTVLRRSDHARAAEDGEPGRLSSYGRPVPLADVRLAGDDLRDAAPGEPGEIVASGPHIARRYWNRPEETESVLGGGWFRTGDVAVADDRGFLYIVERKKGLIVSGGFQVYPKEVEAALITHPAVRDVAVIGVPDEKWGESVKAIVVTDPARPVPATDLIRWAKERKGPVCAPKTVDFTGSIPRTVTGDHDRRALRAAYSNTAGTNG